MTDMAALAAMADRQSRPHLIVRRHWRICGACGLSYLCEHVSPGFTTNRCSLCYIGGLKPETERRHA